MVSPPEAISVSDPHSVAIQVVDAPRSHHGESPVWDAARGCLHWVDLTAGKVHHLHADGVSTTDVYDSEITAIVSRADGGLVAGTSTGIATLSDAGLRPLATICPSPQLRMNDGACDPVGRFLVGSMAYAATPGAGALHRVDLDGSVTAIIEGVTIPNGIDWSLDGAVLYFTDSGSRTITAYRYDVANGEISSPRIVVALDEVDGEPDGLTVDADGNLWVAVWDGWEIRKYSADGLLLKTVPVPVQRPTSLAFGGPDLRDLYITTSRYELTERALDTQPAAGSLLKCRPGTTGRTSNASQISVASPHTTRS